MLKVVRLHKSVNKHTAKINKQQFTRTNKNTRPCIYSHASSTDFSTVVRELNANIGTLTYSQRQCSPTMFIRFSDHQNQHLTLAC